MRAGLPRHGLQLDPLLTPDTIGMLSAKLEPCLWCGGYSQAPNIAPALQLAHVSVQTDDFPAPSKRMLGPDPASPNEEAVERALRPKLVDEYVGQA